MLREQGAAVQADFSRSRFLKRASSIPGTSVSAITTPSSNQTVRRQVVRHAVVHLRKENVRKGRGSGCLDELAGAQFSEREHQGRERTQAGSASGPTM